MWFPRVVIKSLYAGAHPCPSVYFHHKDLKKRYFGLSEWLNISTTVIAMYFSSLPQQGRLLQVTRLSVYVCIYVSLSDSWGIGDLDFNLTGTLIRLIYRHYCTAQKIVIDEKYIDDFRLEDEGIEDSTEQIEPKHFLCEKVNIMPNM